MLDINDLLAHGEKFNVEAKKAEGGLPNSFWETYSAFANTFGGTILLGVDEDKKSHKLLLVGLPDPEKLRTELWNLLNNRQKISANILFEDNVFPVTVRDKTILVVEVPRADRHEQPVFVGKDFFKGTYRRNHEGDYHCTPEAVKAMLRDQVDTPQDAMLLEELEMDCLEADTLKRYRTLFRSKKPQHVWNALPDGEFLTKVGAARKGRDGQLHPTLAGLLFFGNFITITDTLPHFFLDYREHMLPNVRWSDRVCTADGDWSGNVFDFYYKVAPKLANDLPKPFSLQDGLYRNETDPLRDALHEALVNALVHADYYGRRGVVIDKTPDRITLTNPGLFRIGVSEAIAGGISDARNGRIFGMFSLVGVGERAGTGLCDIFAAWAQAGLPEPRIEEQAEEVCRTRLELVLPGASQRQYPQAGGSGELFIHEAQQRFLVPHSAEERVLDFLRHNPTAAYPQIMQACDLNKSALYRLLRRMKETGRVVRLGSTHGSWQVVDTKG